MRTIWLIGLGLALFACHDDQEAPDFDLDGEYTGVFERDGNTSLVALTLDNGNFNGESEIQKFPALCRGEYRVSGNTVTFTNSCAWTAEFDWSLILADTWDFDVEGKVLTLTKSNGDTYTLTRE